MVKYIKTAIESVEKKDTLMLNALVVIITCDIQADIMRGIYDLPKLAKFIKHEILTMGGEPGLMNILDYADMYAKLGGNSILFLKCYQNYIGPIE